MIGTQIKLGWTAATVVVEAFVVVIALVRRAKIVDAAGISRVSATTVVDGALVYIVALGRITHTVGAQHIASVATIAIVGGALVDV